MGKEQHMASAMLVAMLLLTVACWAYAFAVVFVRARAIVLEREGDSAWARALVGPNNQGR
jgi:heme exporter protein C